MRHLCQQEQGHHRQKHGRGAIVLARAIRFVAAALGFKLSAPLVGPVHGHDEQDGEDNEQHAGDELDEDGLYPVVEGVEEGLGDGAVREVVVRVVLHGRAVGARRHLGHSGGVGRFFIGDPDETDWPRGLVLGEGGHQVVGDADDAHTDVDGENGQLDPQHAAEAGPARGETDEEVAEDGQRDGQPDGHRVRHHAEVDVEQHEADPVGAVRGGELQVRVPQDIEVDADRQVGRHGEQVGHGQPHQDQVGLGHHVLTGEHHNVGQVGHDAPDAHQGGDVAVIVGEVLRELHQRRVLRLARGAAGRGHRGQRRVLCPYGRHAAYPSAAPRLVCRPL